MPIAVVLLALAMLAVVLVPATSWHQPRIDNIYRGFDPGLLSISTEGLGATNHGVVAVGPDFVTLATVTSSRPSFHLVTTSLGKFTADLDVVILDSGPETIPLRLGIWSPRSQSGYFITFGPPPENQIRSELVKNGIPVQTLEAGTVVASNNLGTYFPGFPYHLRFSLDKEAGIIRAKVAIRNAAPSGHAVLVLAGGPSSSSYADVVSDPVQVIGNATYDFGGLVRVISGTAAYKFDVEWLDRQGGFISFVDNWKPIQELNGWTDRHYRVAAPAGAAFARLLLGSGDGTTLLFADPRFSPVGEPRVNLLANSDFAGGVRGWAMANGLGLPEVVHPGSIVPSAEVDRQIAPELFGSLKLSLTASASSATGTSGVRLSNYVLTDPHQVGPVTKVEDRIASILVGLLAVLGLLLVAAGLVRWAKARRFLGRKIRVASFVARPNWLLIALGIGMTYFLGNALLFKLGASPFDMTDQQIWTYVAVGHGGSQLYMLPDFVSVAKVWGGAPYHEAVFPYEPIMAYLFVFIGWVYRFLLSGNGIFNTATFAMEFLIKFVNVLFGLADGAFIFLILRQIQQTRRFALTSALFFIFNPALWFSMSIWGANHVISLFFVLASLWLAERGRPVEAWVALAIAALTRPQMLVIGFLVGLIYLRKFPPRQSVHGMAWSVIILFLLLTPFMLRTSPSLPIDVMADTVRVQEFGGNERDLSTLSSDAYSVWPLVSYYRNGLSGLDRVFYPSANNLIGSLSYQRVAQLLTLSFLAGIALLILKKPRAALSSGGYFGLLALGVVGFLLLITGIAAAHFVLALPFLILSRQALKPSYFGWVLAIWTVTTTVAMYGILSVDLAHANFLAYPLFSDDPTYTWLTQFVRSLYSSDHFITFGSVANILVLVTMAIVALKLCRGLMTLTWRRPASRPLPASLRAGDQPTGREALLEIGEPVRNVICRQCGQVNDPARFFCGRCGATRDTAGSTSPR